MRLVCRFGGFWLLVNFFWVLVAGEVGAQSIELEKEGGEVWSHEQVVVGRVEGLPDGPGVVVVEGTEYPFESTDGAFSVAVRLGEGTNTVVARTELEDGSVVADTIALTLGYALRPEVEVTASTEGGTVLLQGRVLDNPDGGPLTFEWRVDASNPETVTLTPIDDTTATAAIPPGAAPGEYYFGLSATDGDGDSFFAQTFVWVDSTGIRPFDVSREHASWIDEAVLYEITPYIFNGVGASRNGRLVHIVNRIPELAELGVNTLWIQPVFGTHGRGQGYDVTDFFNVRPDLGDEEDLHEVVRVAKEHGMRVLLDFVPNHSSIHHPYAEDAIEHGERSQYYDFFMRENDGAPYSQHYNEMQVGEMTFIYYFWTDLVTFNLSNPEVQRFIVEASRYWIETFDVDGYRFDAVWGPFARNPDFVIEWRRAMKRIKPDIFLLAEDKAPRPRSIRSGFPSIFEAFDAAYDWTDDMGYISEWAYERGGSRARTIFNAVATSQRVEAIQSALTNDGRGFHPDAKILRYLENNDTPRFIGDGQSGCGGESGRHSVEQTRMAATFMFTIPGVPMLYNGQEVGYECHPYVTGYIFNENRTMRSHDSQGLYPFYARLVEIRTSSEALQSDHFEELSRETTEPVFAYHRWAEGNPTVGEGAEHVLGLMNMGPNETSVLLDLPWEKAGMEASETYYLTDLFTGEVETLSGARVRRTFVAVDAYSTRLLALADHAVPVSVEDGIVDVPGADARDGVLGQSFPNPASRMTTVELNLPLAGRVRLSVVDLLGRTVDVALQGEMPAGLRVVELSVGHLASGVYFLRLEYEGGVESRRMVVVR